MTNFVRPEGVAEGVCATAICTVMGALVAIAAKHLPWLQFGDYTSLVAVIVAATLLLPIYFVLRRSWNAFGRVWHFLTLSKSRGDRIGIVVAQFKNDSDGKVRNRVVLALNQQLGRVVEILRPRVMIAISQYGLFDTSELRAQLSGRKLLTHSNADLLIWGEVDDGIVQLRFATLRAKVNDRPESYLFDQKLQLPKDFNARVGTAIAAIAANAAAPAVNDTGKYLAVALRPVSVRLARFLGEPLASLSEANRGSILYAYALVCQTIGEQTGDAIALESAISAYRNVLGHRTQEFATYQWAAAQNGLGNALVLSARHDSGAAKLEEAAAAFREALKEWTCECDPLAWAGTQNNLGNVLLQLGEREAGTVRVEQAVAAFSAALRERTRDRVAHDWATTQSNLGNALATLGEREKNTDKLKQAIAAYRSALEVWTREDAPLSWAMAHNNLGAALNSLGAREEDSARLEEAVLAFREALKERKRERVPLDWATTQNNLGDALSGIGQRENDIEKLKQSIVAYREALKEWTRERVPLLWAGTQNNLGLALEHLSVHESGTAGLEEAVARIREALEEYTRANVYYMRIVSKNLDSAEALLESRRAEKL